MPRIGKLSRRKTLHTARPAGPTGARLSLDPDGPRSRQAASDKADQSRTIPLRPQAKAASIQESPPTVTLGLYPSRWWPTTRPREIQTAPWGHLHRFALPNTPENQPIIRPGDGGALVSWPPAGRREPPLGPMRPRCGGDDQNRVPPVGRRRRRSETSRSTRPPKRPICQKRATIGESSAKPPLRHRGQCSAKSTFGREDVSATDHPLDSRTAERCVKAARAWSQSSPPTRAKTPAFCRTETTGKERWWKGEMPVVGRSG